MGASVGTDTKGSVNVELNVVPFIDLMSCLTAFLLVTAVWSRFAQLDMQPTQQGQSADTSEPPPPNPKLCVLVKPDQILFGLGTPGSAVDWQTVERENGKFPWPKVQELLKALKADALLGKTNPNSETIEVGASESMVPINGTDTPVVYQDIIHVMDAARLQGFKVLQLKPPGALSNKPQMF